MTDVSSMGMTTFKTINVSSIKTQTNTSKDVNFKRSLTLNAQDDSGETTALYFELKSVAPAVSTSQSQIIFSLPIKIKKVAAAAVGTDLVPKNVIDTIVDTPLFFTGFPTRLIYPSEIGWNDLGSDHFKASIDSGVIYTNFASSIFGSYNNLFICNKPLPTTAGSKVYIELELLYSGDNGNPSSFTVYEDSCPFAIGLVNEDAWDNTTQYLEDNWATFTLAVGQQKCGVVFGKLDTPDKFKTCRYLFPSGDITPTYVDSVDYFRSGLRIQVGYDIDSDDLELIMFDGPLGNGSVNGIRMKNIFTDITGGSTLDPLTYFYVSLVQHQRDGGDPAFTNQSAVEMVIPKNKIGYYRGDMIGVVELT